MLPSEDLGGGAHGTKRRDYYSHGGRKMECLVATSPSDMEYFFIRKASQYPKRTHVRLDISMVLGH
jgi:hypothetical protein